MCVVADRLFMLDGWICGKWDWSREPMGSDELEEFQGLLCLCKDVRIGADKVVWGRDSLDGFSVRNIKDLVFVNTYTAPTFVFEWNCLVPKKVVLWWRSALARLPTFDALVKRNILVNSKMCPFCGDIEESVEHIFISCGLAQSLWSVIS
ncbi:uncharacterized protein LOC143608493 [Bidens hawaiensis]|uniref:uncharacterized protein LOC143608493 n=1 Tax=Bidens hawaiensis TaxID=980011 RepID=UPI00404A84A1